MTDRLWDPRLDQLGVTVSEADTTRDYWRLKAAWLTVNGSWDDVPDWARKWQLDTLGGDRHVFGRCLDKTGNPLMGAGFVLSWPDGADQRTPEADGWANLPINAGFDWQRQHGPYSWGKFGNSAWLTGLGLPYGDPMLPWLSTGEAHATGGMHVSYFCCWQECGPVVEPEPPEPEPSCWSYLGQFVKCIFGRL